MGKCKDCAYYDNYNCYKGTGYCTFNELHAKDDESCYDFDEKVE